MHAGTLTGRGKVALLWRVMMDEEMFAAPHEEPRWWDAADLNKRIGWSTALATHIAALRQQARKRGWNVVHKQEIRNGKRRQYYRLERVDSVGF